MMLLFVPAIVSQELPPLPPINQQKDRHADYKAGSACLRALMQGWDGQVADRIELHLARIIEFGSEVISIMPTWGRDAAEDYAKLAFAYADHCLKAGQLDRANSAYRAIIKDLPGDSAAGHRDRAKLGIDDVREARAKK